jgi:hypothetical protein
VRGEGNSRNTVITETKEEAIKIGRNITKNQKSELIIHGGDGKIKDNPPRRTVMEMIRFHLEIRSTKLSFQPRIKCGINSSENPE